MCEAVAQSVTLYKLGGVTVGVVVGRAVVTGTVVLTCMAGKNITSGTSISRGTGTLKCATLH